MHCVEKRKDLTSVAHFCKTLQPNAEAVFPSEQINPPVNSPEGLNFHNTVHVDSFLYDEADVQDMTEEGKIPSHYCKDCGSKNCGEIEIMTHSCGRDDLEFIFDVLLPDLTGKTVLDVGSRLGAVLYGAYVFSKAQKIVGIEMNPDLCNITHSTLQQFRMLHKVDVVNAELSTRLDLLQGSDVIILNNVFDWFVPIDVQVKLWQLIKEISKWFNFGDLTRSGECAGDPSQQSWDQIEKMGQAFATVPEERHAWTRVEGEERRDIHV